MNRSHHHKLSRRGFTGAALLGALTPGLLEALTKGEPKQQEKKISTPPPPTAEEQRQRAREAVRAVAVPMETEPAFVFRAADRAERS
jgi:hypothetical protein